MSNKNAVEFVAYGETLKIISQGPVWVAPSTGEQFVSAKDAARVEIAELLSAGGDRIEDFEDEVFEILRQIKY
jgi:hypothetical protein